MLAALVASTALFLAAAVLPELLLSIVAGERLPNGFWQGRLVAQATFFGGLYQKVVITR